MVAVAGADDPTHFPSAATETIAKIMGASVRRVRSQHVSFPRRREREEFGVKRVPLSKGNGSRKRRFAGPSVPTVWEKKAELMCISCLRCVLRGWVPCPKSTSVSVEIAGRKLARAE